MSRQDLPINSFIYENNIHTLIAYAIDGCSYLPSKNLRVPTSPPSLPCSVRESAIVGPALRRVPHRQGLSRFAYELWVCTTPSTTRFICTPTKHVPDHVAAISPGYMVFEINAQCARTCPLSFKVRLWVWELLRSLISRYLESCNKTAGFLPSFRIVFFLHKNGIELVCIDNKRGRIKSGGSSCREERNHRRRRKQTAEFSELLRLSYSVEGLRESG